MRFAVYCVLLLILIVSAHCLYYRHLAQQRLNRALSQIETQPRTAFATIEPVLESSNLVTLGKVVEARQRFTGSIVASGLKALTNHVPDYANFFQMRDCLLVLDNLKPFLNAGEWDDANLKLLRALHDSIAVERERGMIDAWQGMMHVLTQLRESGPLRSDVFGDFEAWFAALKNTPTRTMALRQARRQAIDGLQEALDQMHVPVEAGRNVEEVPPRTRDAFVATAEQILAGARGAITRFNEQYGAFDAGEQRYHSEELEAADNVLAYDAAVLRLAYVEDRLPLVERAGGSYMAQDILLPLTKQTQIPAVDVMFTRFMMETETLLTIPPPFFHASPVLDESLRRAYEILALNATGRVNSILKKDDTALGSTSADLAALVKSGAGTDVLRAMRKTQRSLLITRLPLPEL